ncbi:MAG: T9SS type A sorting domain-containing protein [Bacteroidota bacterium]
MKLTTQSFILFVMITIFMIQFHPLMGQTVKAVNDTIDLYPGVPRVFNLLANDTVPMGDSIKVLGGNSSGEPPIVVTSNYLGFKTYTVSPLWGFNGNLTGSYTIFDYTLSKNSKGYILFRIHDRSYDSLDINNVKAAITAYGNEFILWAANKSIFKVPKWTQQATIFNFVPWIGGKGDDSLIYLAAEKYRQGQTVQLPGFNPDFYAGPIMDSVNYSIYQDTVWNRVWKISKIEIEYHKTHWNQPGYKIPENIFTWPGDGNVNYGQAAHLAPYHDNNGDGIYRASDGDYPLFRGDQAIFAIFNDDRGNHRDSGGRKMKLEFHMMAYAFNLPDDSAFKNTIFIHYKILNRSSRTYYQTYLGAYMDLDIGYMIDDFIGCNVDKSSVIGFNGKPVDGPPGDPAGYGPHPPAQSVTILGGPRLDPIGHDRPKFDISGHRLCDESVNGTGFGDSIADNERYGLTNFLAYKSYSVIQHNYMSTPETPLGYYQNLQSIWVDSTHLWYGGYGHAGNGGYGPDCRFMFPFKTDTLNWGTGCQPPNGPIYWTEKTAAILPDDIRGMASMGPFTFLPGDTQELDIAFIFARDYTGQDTLNPSVDKLGAMIDIVRNSYNTGKLPNDGSFFGINDPQTHPTSSLKIYPNPASELVNIQFDNSIYKNVIVRIVNTNGVVVYSTISRSSGRILVLKIPNLLSGLYFINAQNNDINLFGKMIINK